MTRGLLFGLVLSSSFLSVYSQAPSISVQAGIATSARPVQVLYANGQYIAVFNPLQLYGSADAIHWTAITAPAVSLNGKLAFGAGRYVCITDGGKIYSSTDLVSWTVFNSPLGASGSQTDVEFLNGAFRGGYGRRQSQR
jgi:beta-xylosidase